MIKEVGKFVSENYPSIKNIGVLSTIGSFRTKVFSQLLEPEGFKVILPNEGWQQKVHQAIYDPNYGIKAHASPVPKSAKNLLLGAVDYLQQLGSEAIVLGCSEIALAILEANIGNTVIIDPTQILARALIREVEPSKLKPA